MDKSERLGVERLPRADFKTLLYEVAVAALGSASEDLHAAVSFVGKERMAYVGHMSAYLMGTPCLEPALYEGGVGVSAQDTPMSDGRLALVALGRKDSHTEPVLGVSGYIALDASLVSSRVAPYEGLVEA